MTRQLGRLTCFHTDPQISAKFVQEHVDYAAFPDLVLRERLAILEPLPRAQQGLVGGGNALQ